MAPPLQPKLPKNGALPKPARKLPLPASSPADADSRGIRLVGRKPYAAKAGGMVAACAKVYRAASEVKSSRRQQLELVWPMYYPCGSF